MPKPKQKARAPEPRLDPDLALPPDAVLPTGNDWVALPTIRAADGAIRQFNVLHMAARGLLEVSGPAEGALLQPFLRVDGVDSTLAALDWRALGCWVPRGVCRVGDLEVTFTVCAPLESHGALIVMSVRNSGRHRHGVELGLHVNWALFNRVTYGPVELKGVRAVGHGPWSRDSVVFSFSAHDTLFAWSLRPIGPGASLRAGVGDQLGAIEGSMEASANQPVRAVVSCSEELAPGATAQACFALGVGLEHASAESQCGRLLALIDRRGIDGAIEDTVTHLTSRHHRLPEPELEVFVNRNLFFNRFYAWGKTLDTEKLVGITSRSPRYYVSAAYWDRDSMLWSYPALLETDLDVAREALEYALTTQLANTGIHSRFIDGPVLEGGLQLDCVCGPLLSAAAYARRAGRPGRQWLADRAPALNQLVTLLMSRRDSETGLFTTEENSQDEPLREPFIIYANVLVWKTLGELSGLAKHVNLSHSPKQLAALANGLKKAILRYGVVKGPHGPQFAFATDGKTPRLFDVPPGSLLRLPALGFCDESDPPFKGTLAWIHAPQREHNFSDKPFGLPGNQRLPFTPCWTVADHLRLKSHQATVIEMLRRAGWDAGIVSEGLDPDTGMDVGGGSAFATAAGYVAFTALDVLRSGSPHKLAKTTALDVSKKRRIGVGKRRKVRRRG